MATKYEGMLECRKCGTNENKSVKYLGCLHIYCTSCLSGMITTDSCVRCDRCKARTQLDTNGISGLPDCNVAKYSSLIRILNDPKTDIFCHDCKMNTRSASLYCFDCEFFLCATCHSKSHKLYQAGHVKVLNVSEMKGRNVDQILEMVGQPECAEHPGEMATFFDTDSNIPICNFHNPDNVKPLSSVVKERHQTIQNRMAKSLKVAEVMKKRLNDLSALKITISKDQSDSVDAANDYFDNLVDLLEYRRQEVLKEIQTKSELSHKTITKEMEKQEGTIEKYFDAQQYIKLNLDNLPNAFLLKDFEAIDWHLGHFIDQRGVETATLRGLSALDIPQFKPEDGLEQRLSKTGEIEGGNQQQQQQQPPKPAPKPFKPKVVARADTPKDTIVPSTPPKVRQRSRKSNRMLLADMKGQSIEPWQIVSDTNNYFILDRNTNIIHVADKCGTICDTFTLNMLLARKTWGLAIATFDRKERLLLSDIHFKHVVMLDKKGQVISVLHKTDTKTFGHPTGIAANPTEKCVGIVDTFLKQVHIFKLTPQYVTSLGEDWLQNPTAVCVDNFGNFIVLDASNPLKFVVLNQRQNFVKHIYPPYKDVAIGMPQSILMGTDGYLCWSDSSTHSIVVVREDGSLIDTYGTGKEGGVEFKCPAGICFDTGGRIVVCDALNNCLVVL